MNCRYRSDESIPALHLGAGVLSHSCIIRQNVFGIYLHWRLHVRLRRRLARRGVAIACSHGLLRKKLALGSGIEQTRGGSPTYHLSLAPITRVLWEIRTLEKPDPAWHSPSHHGGVRFFRRKPPPLGVQRDCTACGERRARVTSDGRPSLRVTNDAAAH